MRAKARPTRPRSVTSPLARRPGGPGPRRLIDQIADRLDDLEVAPFAVAADVVALADPAAAQDQPERAGVVLDVEPVAHVLALAVDRQALAEQRVGGYQR